MAVVLGFVVRLSANEWLWIVLAIGLVWITEAINTAIECLADAVTLDRGVRIGAAKDVAVAAVLFASLTALIIGLKTFVPHLVLH